MSDLIHIEYRFREIQEAVRHPISTACKIRLIRRFLLDLPAIASSAYLEEILQCLRQSVDGPPATGARPDEIIETRDAFRSLVSDSGLAGEDYEGVHQHLTLFAALNFAFAGESARAIKMLGGNPASPTPDVSQRRDADLPFVRFQYAVENIQNPKPALADNLGLLNRWWKETLPSDSSGVFVPVVERIRAGGALLSGCAALRRIHVEVYGSAADRDQLRLEAVILADHEERDHIITAPVRSARALIDETHPELKDRCFGARAGFEHGISLHVGASASLSLAALLYCAMVRTSDGRERVNLSPTVALTGDVDDNGNVLPVDRDSLVSKAEAAFFSPVETLVVPGEQVEAVESGLNELMTAYPHRHLSVVGVRHLRDLLFDRRITVTERTGALAYYAGRAWRRRYAATAVLIIATLLLAIGQMAYGPLDREPVHGEIVGEELILSNRSGQIVDRLPVGSRFFGLGRPFRRAMSTHFALATIGLEGPTYIFWSEASRSPNDADSRLHAKRVGEDSPIWTLPLRFTVEYPQKPDVVHDTYVLRGMVAGDFNADGRTTLIVVVGNSPFFPSLVLELDPLTGDELSRYQHSGHLTAITTIPDPETGGELIVVGGVNNAFRKTCVAILDPNRIEGHGPTAGGYFPANYRPANERRYMCLPETPVNRHLMPPGAWRHLTMLVWDDTRQLIRASVLEAFKTDDPEFPAELFPLLDRDLRIVGFGTSDVFDDWAAELYESGVIDRPLDYRYFEGLREQAVYWDGKGFSMRDHRDGET
jgi:hypothetical protein